MLNDIRDKVHCPCGYKLTYGSEFDPVSLVWYKSNYTYLTARQSAVSMPSIVNFLLFFSESTQLYTFYFPLGYYAYVDHSRVHLCDKMNAGV